MATKDRDCWRTRVGGQSVTFPSGTPKKTVDDYERKIKLGLIDRSLGKEEIKVAAYAKRFQEAYPTIRKRSQSTQLKDSFTLRDHIVPRFGKMLLKDVEAMDVLAWQIELTKKGLAPQTVNNIVSCLSSVFRMAVLEGKAKYNPCASLPRVPRPKVRPVFWTPKQAGQYLAYVRQHAWEDYQIALLAICSGMRPGELQGLLRDCVEFEQGYVDVRRHYCSKTNQLLDGCKSGSEGKVPLPRAVLDALADKRFLGPGDYVFPRLRFNRAYGWSVIRPMAIAAEVPPIGFHKLRHTFASHLVVGRRHAIEVRDLLRHKKIDSSEIYMHLIDEIAFGATDCIANGLGQEAFAGGNVRSLHSSRR